MEQETVSKELLKLQKNKRYGPFYGWVSAASRLLAQVFSCEFCEISENTFFHRTPLVAASADIC